MYALVHVYRTKVKVQRLLVFTSRPSLLVPAAISHIWSDAYDTYADSTQEFTDTLTELQHYLQPDTRLYLQLVLTQPQQFHSVVATAWHLVQKDQVSDAIAMVESKEQQQFLGEYTDMCITTMRSIRNETLHTQQGGEDIQYAAMFTTIGTAAILLLGMVYLAGRVRKQVTFKKQVLVCIDKCQQFDEQQQQRQQRQEEGGGGVVRRSRARSVTFSHSTSFSTPQLNFVHHVESPAERYLRITQIRVRTLIVLFFLFNVAGHLVVLWCTWDGHQTLGDASSLEALYSWQSLPGQLSYQSTMVYMSLFSSVPYPAVDWLNSMDAFYANTVQLFTGSKCGTSYLQGVDDVLQCKLWNNASATPLPTAATSQCFLSDLPPEIATVAESSLNASGTRLATEMTALTVALGTLAGTAFPRNHSAVVGVLGAAAEVDPPPLTCLPCPSFAHGVDCHPSLVEALWQAGDNASATLPPSYSDALLDAGAWHLYVGDRTSSALLRQARLLLLMDQSYRAVWDQSQTGLGQVVEALKERQNLQNVKTQNWSTAAIVATSVTGVVVIICSSLLAFQERRRVKAAQETRYEQEWSLERVLHNRTTRSMLHDFAATLFSQENVHYYLLSEAARRKRWPIQLCQRLMDDFVCSTAEMEINISVQRRAAMQAVMLEVQHIKGCKRLSKAQAQAFLDTQRDVWELLVCNVYWKFLSWSVFVDFVRNREEVARQKSAIYNKMHVEE